MGGMAQRCQRHSLLILTHQLWNSPELSNPHMKALINAFVCVALAIGKAVQLLFFGRLRAIEVEVIQLIKYGSAAVVKPRTYRVPRTLSAYPRANVVFR